MKVTGFDNIERFRSFNLIKEQNNHSVCQFSFVTSSFDEYSHVIKQSVKVIEDDCCLMNGIISQIEFVNGNSENIVNVTCISSTIKLDRETKLRIFQKQNQSYKEIIDRVAGEMNYKVEISNSLQEERLEMPVVQQNETDFVFLIRLLDEAYDAGMILDVEKNVLYAQNIDEAKYEIKKNEVYSIKTYEQEEKSLLEISIQGGMDGKELRQFINTGKIVTWKGKTYIVRSLCVKKIDSVYRFSFIAYSWSNKTKSMKTKCFLNEFVAKVVNNEDPDHLGRVQLDFGGEDVIDDTREDKMWSNILTPYTAGAGGFVFIPDVDDIVKVLWDGVSFNVIGCLRQMPLAEQYQDMNKKQIGNMYNKNICFSEESIEISSGDAIAKFSDHLIQITLPKTNIEVDGEKIRIETSKSIVVFDDDVTINTGILHVEASEEENKIKKSYTCESKNITINASSTTSISGKTKVEIN